MMTWHHYHVVTVVNHWGCYNSPPLQEISSRDLRSKVGVSSGDRTFARLIIWWITQGMRLVIIYEAMWQGILRNQGCTGDSGFGPVELQ
jgi:hypothetical protein